MQEKKVNFLHSCRRRSRGCCFREQICPGEKKDVLEDMHDKKTVFCLVNLFRRFLDFRSTFTLKKDVKRRFNREKPGLVIQ